MLDEMFSFLNTWSVASGIDFELIVVDDKSTDNTSAVIESRMTIVGGQTINLLQLGMNRGKGGAIKAGVEYARGRYILMVKKLFTFMTVIVSDIESVCKRLKTFFIHRLMLMEQLLLTSLKICTEP